MCTYTYTYTYTYIDIDIDVDPDVYIYIDIYILLAFNIQSFSDEHKLRWLDHPLYELAFFGTDNLIV